MPSTIQLNFISLHVRNKEFKNILKNQSGTRSFALLFSSVSEEPLLDVSLFFTLWLFFRFFCIPFFFFPLSCFLFFFLDFFSFSFLLFFLTLDFSSELLDDPEDSLSESDSSDVECFLFLFTTTTFSTFFLFFFLCFFFEERWSSLLVESSEEESDSVSLFLFFFRTLTIFGFFLDLVDTTTFLFFFRLDLDL
ncbi:hypothetical protein FOCC_FOCC003489 [Frankliniella occidentalis]|nr:hypothetical protein FOCC_FOCC003489 [Frankliniella occidentalis]